MRFIVMSFILSFAQASFSTTELKLYRPFIDGELKIVEKRPGLCFEQSQRIKREDAWRCQAGNALYDPCFINVYASQKQAFCVMNPWQPKTIELSLKQDLDLKEQTYLDVSKAYPWGIELAKGQKCLALDEDGRRFFDNLPIRYQCNDKSVLIGSMQRCKKPWSMLQVAQGKKQAKTALIKKAWF